MSISLEYKLQEVENNDKENIDEDKNDLNNSLILNEKFDPKFKADMDTILSMGYDGKMIRKVYIFLKPNDINEALDFLSQQDGIYHHDFMERHGQKNKCFICGAAPSNHINYERNSKNTIINSIRDSIGYSSNKVNSDLVNFNSKKEDKEENNALLNEPLISSEKKDIISNVKKNKEPIYCDLCSEEMTDKEIMDNKLPCNHLFCNDCYLNFLQDKITNNKVGKITCMQFKCPHEFDEKFIITNI